MSESPVSIRSPSAAIRAGLDYPVIDTNVHTNDGTAVEAKLASHSKVAAE